MDTCQNIHPKPREPSSIKLFLKALSSGHGWLFNPHKEKILPRMFVTLSKSRTILLSSVSLEFYRNKRQVYERSPMNRTYMADTTDRCSKYAFTSEIQFELLERSNEGGWNPVNCVTAVRLSASDIPPPTLRDRFGWNSVRKYTKSCRLTLRPANSGPFTTNWPKNLYQILHAFLRSGSG
jgi:hypothetical protein